MDGSRLVKGMDMILLLCYCSRVVRFPVVESLATCFFIRLLVGWGVVLLLLILSFLIEQTSKK